MRTTVPPAVRAWVHRVTGHSVARVRRLPGASSAAVHRLDLDDETAVVLRRYVLKGFLESEPDAPVREVECLGFARSAGLAVPEVIAVDVAGDDIGDGVPSILMSFLRGRAVAVPDITRLAEVAASVHAINADRLGHDYFAWHDTEMTTPPPESSSPELWDRAIEIRRTQPPPYTPTLIHRDFHHRTSLQQFPESADPLSTSNAVSGVTKAQHGLSPLTRRDERLLHLA